MKQLKIVIIGAGMGGLQAAFALAKGGADVSLYEKKPMSELCYDWTDDIEQSLFADLDITIPQSMYHRSAGVALVAPFSDKPLRVAPPPDVQLYDYVVERRQFSILLCERAINAGAKLYFESPVTRLEMRNGCVAGVCVSNKTVICDLVIDSSGVYSPFRASLPETYKITANPRKGEVFRVWRAFFNPAKDVQFPAEYPKKVYLKHLGELGISWCMCEPSGKVNVLVGRTDDLPQATLDNAFEKLKADNPVIGDTIVRGGDICTIPIRYPLSRMVGKGYAAIGDAAFMTIPMIGSGISHSIRAGQIIADVILQNNSVSIDTLWKYQVRYFTEIGAGDLCVDKIKRMLLSAQASDIRYLFENGVISEREMGSISTGEAVTMSGNQIISKIINGRKRLGVLFTLAMEINKGTKAQEFAMNIPTVFDEAAVSRWQKKLDAFFD